MSDWLMVANPHFVRIYDIKSRKNIRFSREIHHAEDWVKSASTHSTQHEQGSFNGAGVDKRAAASSLDTQRFAKRIADLIEHGRVLGLFQNWHCFATPEIHRAIRQHLTVASLILIKHSATNDYTQLAPEELLNIVYPEYETMYT